MTRTDISEIIEKLKEDLDTEDPLFNWLLPAFEAFLLLGYLSDDENKKIIEEIRQAVEREGEVEIEHKRRMLSDLQDNIHKSFNRRLLKEIISWLDIIGNLSFEKTAQDNQPER